MKVAILFFGLTRSLKYTIDSIKEKVFNVLTKHNIEYDTYLHTYSIKGKYVNKRARESIDSVDNEEYKILQADYVEIDDQDEVKTKLKLEQYRTHRDPWDSKYNCVDNFILAQFSKARCVQMVEKTNKQYDYVIYMRPDCKYLNNLDINYFKLVTDTSICIPNFHLYGIHKFNDRFCILNMNNYKFYGNIFIQLLSISKCHPLHSETVLGREMIVKHKLTVHKVKFNFSRVRMCGKIVDIFK